MSNEIPFSVAARIESEQGAARTAPEAPSLDRQLWRLLDMLLVIRLDLSSGLMPRAARITGTTRALQLAVNRIDAAIALAKEASALLEGSDETNEDAPKRFMETRVARRYRATLRDAAKVHDAHSKPLTTAYQGD